MVLNAFLVGSPPSGRGSDSRAGREIGVPTNENVPSDEELMVAYGQGQTRALQELYGRYQSPVFGFAYRMLGNPEMAMDVVQEAFLRVHRGREKYVPTASFSSWLFRIARNLCIDEKRRYWNRQVLQESQIGDSEGRREGFLEQQVGPGPTGEDHVFDQQVQGRIESAIQELSPEQREVFLLSRFEQMPYKEIGKVLGISTESVKQRAYRAHLRLRELLRDLVEE
jgi:RNA polymerase sigma-70 factor (ECF subfamily)